MKRFTALILAAVCMLLLSACSNDPAKWAHELKADNINDVEVWNMYSEGDVTTALTAEKKSELVSLLNRLTDDSFTENSECVGGTPEYGIVIKIDGENYAINQSISPGGELEMEYGGKLWWIDNNALTDFVKGVTTLSPGENKE